MILEVAERDGGFAQRWIFFDKLLVLHYLRSHHYIIILKYIIEIFIVGGQILAAVRSENFYFAQ